MSNNSYVWADLPRTGLGNRLIPWAESVVCAHIHNMPRLFTRWSQLILGPALRGESDKRFYLGQFKPSQSELGWGKSIALRTLLPIHDAAEASEGIYRFWSYMNFFGKLYGHEQLIMKELLAVTEPRHTQHAMHAFIPDKQAPAVGMHIRMGDFQQHERTSITYFTDCIKWIREITNTPVRGLVFSDGKDSELGPILDELHIEVVRGGSAVSDLLALSLCDVVIGSANSTYSSWAGFLGGMPLLLDPRHPQEHLALSPEKRMFQGSFDPHNANEQMKELVRKGIGSSKPKNLEHRK